MREDKLPELGAEDPFFLHPHLEFHWQTFLPLTTLSSQERIDYPGYSGSLLHSGAGAPSCGHLRNDLSLNTQGLSTPLAWG